jgi:hypothetical protein
VWIIGPIWNRSLYSTPSPPLAGRHLQRHSPWLTHGTVSQTLSESFVIGCPYRKCKCFVIVRSFHLVNEEKVAWQRQRIYSFLTHMKTSSLPALITQLCLRVISFSSHMEYTTESLRICITCLASLLGPLTFSVNSQNTEADSSVWYLILVEVSNVVSLGASSCNLHSSYSNLPWVWGWMYLRNARHTEKAIICEDPRA